MDRLIKLRKQNNLTQHELAAILHVDQTTVSLWEKGKAKPSVTKIKELADYFNVSTDYLLGHSEQSFIPQKWNDETIEMMDELHKNSDLKMLFKATKNLSPEDIKKTINIIKAFKGEE